MKRSSLSRLSAPIGLALAAVALSAATGLAFALWMDNGAKMLMSLVESGLAWCF